MTIHVVEGTLLFLCDRLYSRQVPLPVGRRVLRSLIIGNCMRIPHIQYPSIQALLFRAASGEAVCAGADQAVTGSGARCDVDKIGGEDECNREWKRI